MLRMGRVLGNRLNWNAPNTWNAHNKFVDLASLQPLQREPEYRLKLRFKQIPYDFNILHRPAVDPKQEQQKHHHSKVETGQHHYPCSIHSSEEVGPDHQTPYGLAGTGTQKDTTTRNNYVSKQSHSSEKPGQWRTHHWLTKHENLGETHPRYPRKGLSVCHQRWTGAAGCHGDLSSELRMRGKVVCFSCSTSCEGFSFDQL